MSTNLNTSIKVLKKKSIPQNQKVRNNFKEIIVQVTIKDIMNAIKRGDQGEVTNNNEKNTWDE